jgi:hypothetical protein
LKRNFDTISALIVFSVIVFIYWVLWVSNVLRDVLVIVVSPVLTAIGVFIAHRLNEKIKNPKLRIVQWGRHNLNNYSTRIFVEVENSAGREAARDARATITIKKIVEGQEANLESKDLAIDVNELVDYDQPLVSELNPSIEGEPIPWMIAEMPYQSMGFKGAALKHITNIGPGQRNKAHILDVIRLRDGNLTYYYLRFFSEYGTDATSIKLSGTTPQYLRVRLVKCVLKSESEVYRLYLKISADKTHPVTGVIEIDTKKGEIICREPPRRETISLTDLEPIDKSKLPPGGWFKGVIFWT